MSTQATSRAVYYPESDGLLIADNTLQFHWITTIVGGLEALFRDNPNVFVAGDFFWYPVAGDNKARVAPDAMVVFGRPKGDRRSYLQWLEDDIAPQVVFEVRSPNSRFGEWYRKLAFYHRFGVEEYYLLNPEPIWLDGWLREGEHLREIAETNGWVSPRLGIRFEISDEELRIVGPDGCPFETYVDIARRAEEERRRAERLAEKLRAAGIDPDV